MKIDLFNVKRLRVSRRPGRVFTQVTLWDMDESQSFGSTLGQQLTYKPFKAMPTFAGLLSEKQMKNVATYVATLK